MVLGIELHLPKKDTHRGRAPQQERSRGEKLEHRSEDPRSLQLEKARAKSNEDPVGTNK